MSAPLGVLLAAPGHERAHLALMVATAAAALGRPVTLFATNGGLALLRAPTPLADDAREALCAARGVAGVAELLDAARALGVRLLACDAALRLDGLDAAALAEGVEVAGLVTFLAAAPGAMVTL